MKSALRIFLASVAAGSLATALALAVAQGGDSTFEAHLRALADNAALAGVVALGTSDAATEAGRTTAAVDATRTTLAGFPGTVDQIDPSVDRMTVSVTLSAQEPAKLGGYFGVKSKTIDVTSTARYVAPASSQASPSAMQQFSSTQSNRLVLWSRCAPECGTPKLR